MSPPKGERDWLCFCIGTAADSDCQYHFCVSSFHESLHDHWAHPTLFSLYVPCAASWSLNRALAQNCVFLQVWKQAHPEAPQASGAHLSLEHVWLYPPGSGGTAGVPQLPCSPATTALVPPHQVTLRARSRSHKRCLCPPQLPGHCCAVVPAHLQRRKLYRAPGHE